MATQGAPVTPGDRPPRLGRVPIIDNTLAMFRDPLAFYDRVGELDADVVGYNVAGTTGYFLTHPDLVERVLVTDAADFEKGTLLQETLGEFIGEGLFLRSRRVTPSVCVSTSGSVRFVPR